MFLIKLSSVDTINPPIPDDLFITTSSFEEERSMAVCNKLDNYKSKTSLILNFHSDSNREGEQKKARSEKKLLEKLSKNTIFGIPRIINVEPFNYTNSIEAIKEELKLRGYPLKYLNITFDVSCLTKVQLIFLLKFFLENANNLRLYYTSPRIYNAKPNYSKKFIPGYSDPVSFDINAPKKEAIGSIKRVALVIAGHEGQRTMYAWERVDPDKTYILIPIADDYILNKICNDENEFFLRRAAIGYKEFIKHEISKLDVSGAKKFLYNICKRERKNIRLTIIPFGPKPLVIGVILAAIEMKNIAINVAYPIPPSYNPNYSEGVENIYFYNIFHHVRNNQRLG